MSHLPGLKIVAALVVEQTVLRLRQQIGHRHPQQRVFQLLNPDFDHPRNRSSQILC